MKQIPNQTKEEAVALRQQGKTYAEISKQIGVSLDWCKRNLKSVRQEEHMKRIPEEVLSQAIELCKQGITYKVISEKLGVSVEWCKIKLKIVRQQEKELWAEVKSKLPVEGTSCTYIFMNNTEVLYVGSTTLILQRLYKHRSYSKFFRESTHILINTHNTYSEMVFNEAQAIAKYKPQYNTIGISSKVSDMEIPSTGTVIIETSQLLL